MQQPRRRTVRTVDTSVKTIYSRGPACIAGIPNFWTPKEPHVKSHRIANHTNPTGAVAACAFVQAMRLGGYEDSTHPGGGDA